jgi:hypothetical protein
VKSESNAPELFFNPDAPSSGNFKGNGRGADSLARDSMTNLLSTDRATNVSLEDLINGRPA